MKTGITTMAILWLFGVSAQINVIIDSNGDGGGNELDAPLAVVADSQGNLYMGGSESDNVFRLGANAACFTTNAPCQWVEIMDATGAGAPGQQHNNTHALAVDSHDHLYVVGRFSDNVWRINNPQVCSTSEMPCEIHEIINTLGDGVHEFDGPHDIVVDHMDNLYVTGTASNNIFRIAASSSCSTQSNSCSITEVADSTGDGNNNLFQPSKVVVDELGNVFTSNFGDNVLMIDTPGDCSTNLQNCMVTEVFSEEDFDLLELGRGLEVDGQNNLFVSSFRASTGATIFRLNAPATCGSASQPCQITEMFNDATPQQADEVVVDGAGNLFVAGGNADSVLRISQAQSCTLSNMDCEITEVISASGDGNSMLQGVRTLAVSGRDVLVPGFGSDNAFRVAGVAELGDLIFEDGFE